MALRGLSYPYNDGEAIIGLWHTDPPVSRHRAEELSDRGAWGLLQHFFSPERHLAVCVLYKEQRYSLRAYHFQGQDVLEHAARVLRLDASRLAACDFHIGDLDVQGDCCPIAVALEAVAAPTGGSVEPERQDVFVLCDLRPLGVKPRCVYSHLPRFHFPSLLADLGIALPDSHRVGVLGARISGN